MPATLGFGSINFSATNLHTNELQANVYPNYPQVRLFRKGIPPKLTINNANLEENSGILGRIRSCRLAEDLWEKMFIIQQFNSQHQSAGEQCLRLIYVVVIPLHNIGSIHVFTGHFNIDKMLAMPLLQLF